MGIAMRVPVSRRLIYSINLIIIEGDKFTRSGDRTHDGLMQYTSGTKHREKGIHAKASPGRQRGLKESCECVSVTVEEILGKYDQRSAARATIGLGFQSMHLDLCKASIVIIVSDSPFHRTKLNSQFERAHAHAWRSLRLGSSPVRERRVDGLRPWFVSLLARSSETTVGAACA